MANNIDKFSIYSAKIFKLLYDSFPIPCSIDRNAVILGYLVFDQEAELRNLKLKSDITETSKYLDDEELRHRIVNQFPSIQKNINDLEGIQQIDKDREKQIYDGTLKFLLSEELLRECNSGEYQLTSKGFSHLDQSFKNGSIVSENRSGKAQS